MNTLLVHFQIDLAGFDIALEKIDRAATRTSEQPGFHSGYWMVDRQSGSAALVTSWDTEPDARAWMEYMQQNPPSAQFQRKSLDIFEVVRAIDP